MSRNRKHSTVTAAAPQAAKKHNFLVVAEEERRAGNLTAADKRMRENFGEYVAVAVHNETQAAKKRKADADDKRRFAYDVAKDSEAYDAEEAAKQAAALAAALEHNREVYREALKDFGFSTADNDLFKTYSRATTSGALRAALVARFAPYATKDCRFTPDMPLIAVLADALIKADITSPRTMRAVLSERAEALHRGNAEAAEAASLIGKKMSKHAFLRLFYTNTCAALMAAKVLRFPDMTEEDIALFLSAKTRKADEKAAKTEAEKAAEVAAKNNAEAAKQAEEAAAKKAAEEEEAARRAKVREENEKKIAALLEERAAQAEAVRKAEEERKAAEEEAAKKAKRSEAGKKAAETRKRNAEAAKKAAEAVA